MADLGELVLRLRVDDSEYIRGLVRARRIAESLKDISVNLRVNDSEYINDLRRARQIAGNLKDVSVNLRVNDSEYIRDLDRAKQRADSLQDIQIRLNPSQAVGGVRDIDSELRKLPPSTSNVGRSFSVLQGVIAGASAAITASLIQIGGALLRLPVNIVGGSLNSFAAFDTELQKFAALSGKTRDELKPLTDEITRLGQETTKTPIEVAQAANTLSQLGAGAEDVQKQLAGVVSLSEATGTGLVEAAELSQIAANIFGFSSEEISDRLSSLAIGTAADVGDVQQLLQQTGGIFNQLGENADPDELLTAFATLRDAGISSEVAATGLRGVIATLVDPKKADELKQLGVEAFDAQGNFLGLENVFRQLQTAQGQFNPEQFTGALIGAFGRESITAITGNLDLLDTKFSDTFKGLKNSVGTSGDVSKTLQEGVSGAREQFGGSLETLDLVFGAAIAPIEEAALRLGSILVNALTGSDIFTELSTAAQGFLTTLQGSGAFAEALGQTLVETFGAVLGSIAASVTQLTTAIQQNPEAILAQLQGFATQVGSAIVSIVQGIGTAVQFIIANFDQIVAGAKALGIALAAAITGNLLGNTITLGQSIVDLGAKLVEFAKFIVPILTGAFTFIAANLSGLVLAFKAGGIAGVVSSLGATFSLFATSLAPILPIIAAVAAAIGVVVVAFKALRSERGQEILGEIAARARELFEAFRQSEAVQATLNVFRALGDLLGALLPVVGRLLVAFGRFALTSLGALLEQLGQIQSAGVRISGTIAQNIPAVKLLAGSAKLLLDAFIGVANATARILDNITAAIQGAQALEGGSSGDLAKTLTNAADAMGTLAEKSREIVDPAKSAGDGAAEVADNAEPPTPTGPKRDLESEAEAQADAIEDAEKKAADALAAAEKKIEDDKITRELAFEEKNRAADLAFEDAKLARQQAFEDAKRAQALALEDEIERRKIATEQQIEAIKEEGRKREEAFKLKQQADEEAFTERQNQEKLAFEDDLAKRRNAAERGFDLGEAGSLDERNKLVEQFAKEDRRAAVLAPFEEEERNFEAQQLADKKAFEEQQRIEAAAFEDSQRALDAQAQELKAQSEAEIRALNLAAKEQEIAAERSFQSDERTRQQQFEEAERSRQRQFNADERAKDLANAQAIERLKASNTTADAGAAITPFKHGGPFSAGQNILAGEAGPEIIRMGGREGLITQPSLMRFDQPGRIFSAPRTRRKMSDGALSKAGVGGELAQMRKMLKSAIAQPRADINTTVEIQGMSPDAMRKQLALHQLDLYRSLGGI